ncbi:MAG TPA: magnesium/cobalt transporter CorA [Tepidisphaeraceae bacterium]|jgi:magnesium transporter|nr:magnesium/cobalt transporter CorA [Tepidisphaeraceae bacterium]
MISAFIKFADGEISTDTSVATLSRAVRDPKATFWVDMIKPTDDEYALLDDVFGFHPLAIEDSIKYLQRPKIESYNHIGDSFRQGYFYMVIHGPDLSSFRDKLRTKELDMFVSERYLITIHDEEMTSVKENLVRASVDPARMLDGGIDILLYHILDRLVDNYGPILENLQEEIDDVEEQSVTDPTPELLQQIATKKRDLLNFRRIIGPQRDVLAQLTRGDVPFIREGTRVYLRDVLDHLTRAVEMIELYRDLIVGARDIYMSSMSNNLNQVMKTLTIITVIALPLNILTGFFGMNFEVAEFKWMLDHQTGFWVTIVLALTFVGLLLYLFNKKKWL